MDENKNGVLDDSIPYGEIITLSDDEGNEVEFDHLMTFRYLGELYIALIPLSPVEGVGEDEIMLMTASEEDQGNYLPIESPVLLQEVFEVFQELFAEMVEEGDDLPELDDLLDDVGEDEED